MFGAVYELTKELSVFAVRSTSLFPTTDKNDFNVTLPATVGKSLEAGFKVELFNGKISGTVSYYQITQTGGSQRDPSAINNNKVAWDGMTAAQRAITFAGLTRDQLTDRSGQLGDLVPGAESESTGLEADLVFQPLKEYQVLFSYAHNNVEVTKALNKSLLGQTTPGSIANQLAMMHKYTFTEGDIKGLSLGLGLQYAGKAFQDYNGAAGAARYNPSTLYAEAFAGYKFKAGGYDQRLQLNVKNLTKQADFVGWQATGSATKIATARYEVPTKMSFTLTYGLDF
jgi:iron complex outermembrane receptor protein